MFVFMHDAVRALLSLQCAAWNGACRWQVFCSHRPQTKGGYRHISKQSVTNTFAQVSLQKTFTSRTPWSSSLCTNLWKPRKRSWVTKNSTWGDWTSTKQCREEGRKCLGPWDNNMTRTNKMNETELTLEQGWGAGPHAGEYPHVTTDSPVT